VPHLYFETLFLKCDMMLNKCSVALRGSAVSAYQATLLVDK
jgi:hypothetical protein